ncbi:MAG: rhomboid family intramembrane serine protease [Silicimonas sp.]|nr:rhomboid family intramembrane serine protease [Silicimonas sp.]
MQDEDFSQPFFNTLPPAVVALALSMFAVEIFFWLGEAGIIGGDEAIGWRTLAIRELGFFPPLIPWMIETGNWAPEHLLRFVSYLFLHWGFTSAIFSIVILLAMGKLVGEVFGNLAVLILFFACGFFGALIFAGLAGSERPLVGAFPSVYGLIGAYTFLLWVRFGHMGQNQYQAFTLIGFLMGIQLFFAIFFQVGSDWIADIAGFTLGFFIAPFLVKGALRQMLNRLRQR